MLDKTVHFEPTEDKTLTKSSPQRPPENTGDAVKISQVVAPRTSEIVEIADPIAGPGQVLIDVLACGVCTSDVTPWREKGTAGNPIRLGHEMVGRIAALGSPGSAWNVGDVVTGLGSPGFAERAVLDENVILRVPAGIDPAYALGEPLACLEEALGRCNLTPDSRVAIVGLGFMGLGLVQLVRRLAPAILVGVDPSADARAHGLANGADEVYHSDELPAAYNTDTGRGGDLRFDLVIEATGVTPGLEVAGSLVRPYGTMCIVGYHHAGTAKLDMNLWYKAVTVVNGFSPDRRRTMQAMARGLELVGTGAFDYGRLITHRFGLDQVDAAYELMLEHGADFVKSVIVP